MVSAVAVLLVVVFLAGFVFWIWALVDAARRPQRQWATAGKSQALWLVVIVLLGWLGALLYCLIARPALIATYDASVDHQPRGVAS
jgi:hypothetical protein